MRNDPNGYAINISSIETFGINPYLGMFPIIKQILQAGKTLNEGTFIKSDNIIGWALEPNGKFLTKSVLKLICVGSIQNLKNTHHWR